MDGDKIWADDTGGDLPTLVLLHPGVGDSRIWEPILPELATHHRVIRFDSRGYGRSPAPTTDFTLLGDLVAVLDHFGIDRTPIAGSSQGGGTALALAVTDPARVSALVLLCPGIPGYPYPEEPEVDADFQRAANEGVDAVAAVGARLWAAAGSRPEVTEQLRSAARAWMSIGENQRPDPTVFDRLGEIAVPTSILVGDLDHPPLIESNLRAADRIAGCELVRVPGVDHMPTLRVPDRVLQLITGTLARV